MECGDGLPLALYLLNLMKTAPSKVESTKAMPT